MENRLGTCRYTGEAFLQGYIVLNDVENGTENKLIELADQVAWVWWGWSSECSWGQQWNSKADFLENWSKEITDSGRVQRVQYKALPLKNDPMYKERSRRLERVDHWLFIRAGSRVWCVKQAYLTWVENHIILWNSWTLCCSVNQEYCLEHVEYSSC